MKESIGTIPVQVQRRGRRPAGDVEHRLQQACVRWFRLQYPALRDVLIAVPNGGRRDAVTGARLKAEGVVAGASDLVLLKPNRFYGALCIEMKTPKGKQSPAQKEWQKAVEAAGDKYVLCRSIDDFMREVRIYIDEL